MLQGQSPWGEYVALAREQSLVGLGFVGDRFSLEEMIEDLCNRPAWCQARFENHPISFKDITSIELWGTPFQIKIWETLYALDRHQTVTYKDIAEKAGYQKGFQAIGQAVSRNPISFVIPCHLVVKSSGEMGEYYWGSAIKKTLLDNFLPKHP